MKSPNSNAVLLSRVVLNIVTDKLMASPAYKAKIRYLSYENRVITEESNLNYHPMDISRSNSNTSEKMSCCEYLRRCLCYIKVLEPESVADNSSAALVHSVGKSYNVIGDNTPGPPTVDQGQGLPTLIVTRHTDEELPSLIPVNSPAVLTVSQHNIENELYKSTTQLLLDTEKRSSSISLGSKYPVKKKADTQCDVIDEVDSRGSTLKFGEKNSFIREVLSCRDSFLKSLEWCDNSLTRGKRYRNIKKDDWIELKGDGIKQLIHLKHLSFHYTEN